MLLERGDVTPNTVDKDGGTTLSWAAGNGHEGIVKMNLRIKTVEHFSRGQLERGVGAL